MGMDVYGKAATSEVGEYFRRSVWGWRPLWEACEHFAPDLTSKVQYGQTNDGDGLDGEDSRALATTLRRVVATGEADRYVMDRDLALVAMPSETCEYCGGTGVRRDSVGVKAKMPERNYCNGCNSTGEVRPFATWYSLDVQDFTDFADFLDACGGFEIY